MKLILVLDLLYYTEIYGSYFKICEKCNIWHQSMLRFLCQKVPRSAGKIASGIGKKNLGEIWVVSFKIGHVEAFMLFSIFRHDNPDLLDLFP